MKKYLIPLSIGLFFAGTLTFAAGVYQIVQGGTGWGYIEPNTLLLGNGTGRLATTTIGSGLTLSGGTLTASGGSGVGTIATSSLETAGQLGYFTTTSGYPARLSGVATGTITCTGSASCGAGSYVIGNNLTITGSASGVSGVGTVSTSSLEVRGNIPYWTSNGAYPATLGTVATGTVQGSGPIQATAGQSIIGSGLTISCPTCLTSLAGAASSTLLGDFNTWTGTNKFGTTYIGSGSGQLNVNGGLVYTGATTTFSAPLSYSGGAVSCPTCYTGSGFDWTPTAYGNATSTTLGFLNGFLSTASSTFTGLAHLDGGASTTMLTTNNLFFPGNGFTASFNASSSQAENTTYYWPIDNGLPGQMLTNVNGTQLAWKNSNIQGLVQYYDTNWASPVAGAYVEHNQQATTTKVYITSGSIGGNNNLLSTFITATGTPGLTTIPEGQWVYHFRALKNAAPDTRIYAEVYKRNIAGTETKLMTTSVSNLLTFVEEDYDVTVSTSSITLLTTDRLEVKVYANINGAGVNVQEAIMGSTQSGIRLPVLFQPGFGLPGGSDTQVQFNDSGVFGGSSSLTFNKTSGLLTIGGGLISSASSTVSSALNVSGNLSASSTASFGSFVDFTAIANPAAPPAGFVRLHALTTQGFSRLEQDNEAATNITLGRDNVFLAKNTSGATINTLQAVYVTGSTGNVPNIGLAGASTTAKLPAVGVALDSIANNAFGQIMKLGMIQSVDTSAFSAGDQVWVSTSTVGGLTNIRPSYPYLVQRIGSVLVSGVGNGSVLIATAPFVGGQESGTISNYTFGGNITTQLSSGLTASNAGTLYGGIATGTISGSGPISVTAGRSAIGGALAIDCTTCALTTRNLTIAGTANQITSSAGAQDLSSDRTWTLSLPNHVIFPSSFQAGNASTTNATTTSLAILNLSAASCDVKSTTGGVIYCGTDATGNLFGQSWNLNAQNNLTPTTTVSVLLPSNLYASSTVWNMDTSTFSLTNSSTTTIPNAVNSWSIASTTQFNTIPILSIDGLNGRVGIGTSVPNAGLTVSGGISNITWSDSTARNTAAYFYNSFTETLPTTLSGIFGVDNVFTPTVNTSVSINGSFLNLALAGSKNFTAIAQRAMVGQIAATGSGSISSQMVGLQGKIQTPSASTASLTSNTSAALEGFVQITGTNTITGISALASNIAFPNLIATASTVRGLYIPAATKGASYTISTLNGIQIDDQTVGGTNIGLNSLISSGANKWNIYAQGTASNYFAGNIGLGTTSPTSILSVQGDGLISGTLSVAGINATGTLNFDTATPVIKQYPAFTYSTTSWSGTTTIPLGTAFVAETWNAVQCFTDAGTLDVMFNDGTNFMTRSGASTTVGTVTLSTNNTFTAAEKRYVNVGNPATSPRTISCSISKTINK